MGVHETGLPLVVGKIFFHRTHHCHLNHCTISSCLLVVFLCILTNTGSMEVAHQKIRTYTYFILWFYWFLACSNWRQWKCVCYYDITHSLSSDGEDLWELVDCCCLFFLITLHLFSQNLLSAFRLFSPPSLSMLLPFFLLISRQSVFFLFLYFFKLKHTVGYCTIVLSKYASATQAFVTTHDHSFMRCFKWKTFADTCTYVDVCIIRSVSTALYCSRRRHNIQ